MYTIIGLGSAGCNIAELFENNPDYKVKLIDASIEGENCFDIKKQNSPEEYEKNIPDLTNFFEDTTQKIVLIVGGSGKISGAALQVLKQLKTKELNVLYIRPDTELLGSIAKMQDRVTFNVLQEYARSAVFKNIFIVNNPSVESIIGDVSIMDYNKEINKIIYNSFNAYIKLSVEEPVIDNYIIPREVCRIITFGIYDLENNIEKLLYPLNFIDDKCYYFVINENELKTNGKLFKLIKERMKEKVLDKTRISYRIHSTTYEQSYCYVVAYSSKIQE
jgi:hypothetical protein